MSFVPRQLLICKSKTSLRRAGEHSGRRPATDHGGHVCDGWVSWYRWAMMGLLAMLVSLVLQPATVVADSDSELSRATWDIPGQDAIQQQLVSWLADTGAGDDLAEQVRTLWSETVPISERLLLLSESFALVDEDARELAEFCRRSKSSTALPSFRVLEDDQKLPFQRNNLRLLYARWLAQYQLYNEALEQIETLQPADVVSPAELLFYQGIAYHRLLKKDQCVPVVERLLERESSLPRRFRTLAKLMRVDIEALEIDSLDEVSRLMDSIRVRLGHGRAGKRVRDEEESVITKLDKLIKKMEDQAAKSSAASAAGQAGDTKSPSDPMQDSMPGGPKGPGNVDAKDIGKQSGWGDLPPKERERALQQLGKDFPSHYRDVIVEYFRKLSREGAEP